MFVVEADGRPKVLVNEEEGVPEVPRFNAGQAQRRFLLSSLLIDQPRICAIQQQIRQRYGDDFSHVRIHTDARAAESAQAVNALAYTVGNKIVFGPGQFSPQSSNGQRLLAHEV